MNALSPTAAEFVSLMKKLRWSQSETARRLFITPSHVNQIVNGKAEPSAAMLQLLRLTGVKENPDLMNQGAKDCVEEPDRLEEFWITLRRRKLDRMPPEEQEEFIEAWSKILGLPFSFTPASRKK